MLTGIDAPGWPGKRPPYPDCRPGNRPAARNDDASIGRGAGSRAIQPGEAELTQLVEQDDPTRVRPGSASQCVIRLVGALLVEINDEMIAAERRYIAAASVAELTDHNVELALPAAPRT
jgi:hypothetical protein